MRLSVDHSQIFMATAQTFAWLSKVPDFYYSLIRKHHILIAEVTVNHVRIQLAKEGNSFSDLQRAMELLLNDEIAMCLSKMRLRFSFILSITTTPSFASLKAPRNSTRIEQRISVHDS